jgi:NADPH:quinone reductase-like Zn-dependent oxidoreductase
MKAIRFDHYGEPADVLTVTEQLVPQPGAREVPHFPAGAGFEGVGVIDAVGPEVEGLSVGQRILEVYWLGYWLPRLDESGFFAADRPAIPQLIDEIIELIRGGILNTSPGEKFGLDVA